MTPLRPALSDVPTLAALHLQAWQETYAGLLPEAEIARFSEEFRRRQWTALLAEPAVRVAWLPGQGFAFSGPQREAEWTSKGYPREIHAIYLLRAAQGRGAGRALFQAVRPDGPFMLWVLDGNTPAIRFYDRMGGTRLLTRAERIGETEITEHAYGWGDPSPDGIGYPTD